MGPDGLEATPDPTPLLDLLEAVLAVVDVPVVAGGGIHDATGVHSLTEKGAVAAQMAYLLSEEAGNELGTGPHSRTPAFTGDLR